MNLRESREWLLENFPDVHRAIVVKELMDEEEVKHNERMKEINLQHAQTLYEIQFGSKYIGETSLFDQDAINKRIDDLSDIKSNIYKMAGEYMLLDKSFQTLNSEQIKSVVRFADQL